MASSVGQAYTISCGYDNWDGETSSIRRDIDHSSLMSSFHYAQARIDVVMVMSISWYHDGNTAAEIVQLELRSKGFE